MLVWELSEFKEIRQNTSRRSQGCRRSFLAFFCSAESVAKTTSCTGFESTSLAQGGPGGHLGMRSPTSSSAS